MNGKLEYILEHMAQDALSAIVVMENKIDNQIIVCLNSFLHVLEKATILDCLKDRRKVKTSEGILFL